MNARTLAILAVLAAVSASARPIREWDWHMPGSVYKELEFTDRATVDRAVKLFQQAVDAEDRGTKVTDLVPRYRAAAGEWRKVQVQSETEGGNEALLAYAIFMQGYAKQQAHDRNEAAKLFNEVLDLYPEQTFIAVPARYMLSVVKRQLGDLKQADAALEEIAEDKAADGHPIFYNVLASLAGVRWGKGRPDEAADLWARIVFTKGKPDHWLWRNSRDSLVTARTVALEFAELEPVLFAGIDAAKRKDRADAVAANAKWISEIDRYGHHGITQYLDRMYPRETKAAQRKEALAKIRKGYAAWLEGEGAVFEGLDDGWSFVLAKLRVYAALEKSDRMAGRVKALENLVKNAKPDVADGRCRTLAMELVALGQGEGARTVAAMTRDRSARLRLQYDVENALQEWKAAAMYLEEFVGSQPPPEPGALKQARYDLAWYYRHRLGAPDKAVKIYQEMDDPPRALWGLAEALRECGKKKESYTTLTEIVSIFPNDAPNAVLRTAQWREQDGEKEKAIGLYRQLLKHPKWKESGASSQAHQALERLGIATGGAMTNEVR